MSDDYRVGIETTMRLLEWLEEKIYHSPERESPRRSIRYVGRRPLSRGNGVIRLVVVVLVMAILAIPTFSVTNPPRVARQTFLGIDSITAYINADASSASYAASPTIGPVDSSNFSNFHGIGHFPSVGPDVKPKANGTSAPQGDPHWWFGTVIQPIMNERTAVVYFNITTPDSFTTGDDIFIGASAWDTLGNYAQEGIVGGGSFWTVTENAPAACGSSNQWCAYFSMCIYSETSDCASTIWPYTGWITWEFGPLQPSTMYQEQMQVSWASDRFGIQTFFSGEFYDNSHHLLNGFAAPYASNSGVYLQIEYQQCNSGYSCSYGFTDYEEVYNLNSVQAWPAFNPHTFIAVHAPTDHLQWSGWGKGSGFPSSNTMQYTASYSGGQNYVIIQNAPFAVWVGTWFGNGFYDFTTSDCACGFQITVPIDPLADPGGGYDVSYADYYCGYPGTPPCPDISFSPTYSIVQPDSDFYTGNAQMTISGVAPGSPATWIVSLYSYDPDSSPGSTYLSQWEITFS